jgi:putative copper export protein
MLGAAGIPLLVITSSTRAEEPGLAAFYRRVTRRIYTLGALAGAFVFSVELVYLAWQITSLTGSDLSAAPQDAISQMLFHTTWGYAWIVRQVLTALLIPLFSGLARASEAAPAAAAVDSMTAGPAKWLKGLAFVLVGGALAAQAFTSHAAGGRDPAFSILLDWLHLVFVGLWVGGLFILGASILPVLRTAAAPHDGGRRSPLVGGGEAPHDGGGASIDFKTIARSTWGRFGPLAALSVGVVVATGLYATGQRIISADALLMTTYGQFLAVKIALMLLAGLAGLLNSLSLHPALSAPLARWLKKPPGWTPFSIRRLPALILVEMGLGIVIALLAGALTTLPPANDVLYSIAPEAQPDAMTAQVDDLYVNLSIKPNRPGSNIINILSSSSRRPAPAEVLRVIVKMTYLEQDFGTLSVDALPSGLDAYRASLDSLTQPGRWNIAVVVRRKGIPDSVASFTWTVLPLGDLRPTLISRSPWKDALSVLAALLALLVAALFGAAWIQTRTPRRPHQPAAKPGLSD